MKYEALSTYCFPFMLSLFNMEQRKVNIAKDPSVYPIAIFRFMVPTFRLHALIHGNGKCIFLISLL